MSIKQTYLVITKFNSINASFTSIHSHQLCLGQTLPSILAPFSLRCACVRVCACVCACSARIGSQLFTGHRSGDGFNVRHLKLMGDLGQVIPVHFSATDRNSITRAVCSRFQPCFMTSDSLSISIASLR
jgi:hypothetical protein